MNRLVAPALLLLLSLAWIVMPMAEWLEWLSQWCRSAGLFGVLVFALAYLVGTLALVPATLLALAAGWVWGLWYGFVFVQVVGTIADVVPFVLARRWFRSTPASAVGPRWISVAKRLDLATSTRGFQIVSLVRWCPILPFNVMNYVLGCTKVPLRTYALATFVACIPSSFVVVYAGTVIENLSLDGTSAIGPKALVTLGLGAVSIVGLSMYAQRILKHAVA